MIQQGIAPVKLYALSFGGMRMLLDYYEKIPEGLRLRLYYQPVSWTKTPKPNNALGEDYFREIFNLVGIYSLY